VLHTGWWNAQKLDGLVGFWRFYSLLTAFLRSVGSQNRVVPMFLELY